MAIPEVYPQKFHSRSKLTNPYSLIRSIFPTLLKSSLKSSLKVIVFFRVDWYIYRRVEMIHFSCIREKNFTSL